MEELEIADLGKEILLLSEVAYIERDDGNYNAATIIFKSGCVFKKDFTKQVKEFKKSEGSECDYVGDLLDGFNRYLYRKIRN